MTDFSPEGPVHTKKATSSTSGLREAKESIGQVIGLGQWLFPVSQKLKENRKKKEKKKKLKQKKSQQKESEPTE